MNRISAILTAAATLALGACASDNMTYSDTRGPDRSQIITTETTNLNGTAVRTESVTVENMHTAVPDNPQLGGGNDKNVAQGLSESDRKFLVYVLRAGQFEVSSGEKALAKSNNAGIRSLAKYLVDDHMKANGQATNLASRRGLRSPLGLSTDQIDKLAQLDRLEGTAFDAEFLSQQKLAHEEAIAIFDAASLELNDKFIRDWAAATVPALRSHSEMIDMLRNDKSSVTMDLRFLNGQ